MAVNRQKAWGTLVVLEFLLSGMASGAYLVGAIPWLVGQPYSAVLRIAALTTGPLLVVGLILLVADLGSPRKLWRSCSRPFSSWMARGAVALIGFTIITLVHLGFELGAFGPGVYPPQALVMVASALAIIIAIYPGVLMEDARGMGPWSNPALLWLFPASAISSGAGWVMSNLALIPALMDGSLVLALTYVALVAIVFQGGLLLLYVSQPGATTGSAVSREMLAGEYRLTFWAGAVVVGIAIPAVLAIWAGNLQMLIMGLSLIAGSFFLRYVLVVTGAYEDMAGLWNVAVPTEMRGP